MLIRLHMGWKCRKVPAQTKSSNKNKNETKTKRKWDGKQNKNDLKFESIKKMESTHEAQWEVKQR